jgi:hypothetical protein
MIRAMAIIVLAAVQLGGSFGEATGATVSLGDVTMVVDLEVEVLVSANAVVAHLSIGEESSVIPLLDRGGGVYGIRTEMSRKDYVVVFEALGPEGALSAATTLSTMGVQLAVPPEPEADDQDEGLSPDTRRWGWLALALGAASLSVLAFWALGARGEPDGDLDSEEE